MIKQVLRDELIGFTLIYGNKSEESSMFLEELKDLERIKIKNLDLHLFFSKENVLIFNKWKN